MDTINVRDSSANGGDTFTVNFEDNYLPNVVLRENGNASFEALKAQAVAARSYAYYKLQGQSYINNGTSDQVYSYGGPHANPGGDWDRAVKETEGEVLTFNGVQVAAFYVAGAIPSGPTAHADNSDYDPTSTERFVTYTYDAGLLGNANDGTSLGYRGGTANRGASSQNGADFQSDQGVHYYDILKYYYGGDIQLESVQPDANFGVKPLAGFERNNDYFNRALTYSGQTRNLAVGTQVSRTNSFAHSGLNSQKLTFKYDAGADLADNGEIDGFVSRHVSGVNRARRLSNITSGSALSVVADPVGNEILKRTGSIGFWLMADPAESALSLDLDVAVVLDNFDDDVLDGDTDQGLFKGVAIDGQWHKYEWFLDDDDAWTSAFAPGIGDGQIASRLSLDSILFQGTGDATVYLDDVFWDPTAIQPVPEPSTMLVLAGLASLAGLRRRRSHGV